MKSYVDHASRDGQIAIACGCSGIVMWRHCNDALLEYWAEEFGIADVCYDHKFVSGIFALEGQLRSPPARRSPLLPR
eukprot:3691282-Lingulodinium_polyedra.AAC.1